MTLGGGGSSPINNPDGSQNDMNWLFENGEEKVTIDSRPLDGSLENNYKNNEKPREESAMGVHSGESIHNKESDRFTPPTMWTVIEGDERGIHMNNGVVPYIPGPGAQKVYNNHGGISYHQFSGHRKDEVEHSANSKITTDFHSSEKENKEVGLNNKISIGLKKLCMSTTMRQIMSLSPLTRVLSMKKRYQ